MFQDESIRREIIQLRDERAGLEKVRNEMMERSKYLQNFSFRTNYNRKNHLDGIFTKARARAYTHHTHTVVLGRLTENRSKTKVSKPSTEPTSVFQKTKKPESPKTNRKIK